MHCLNIKMVDMHLSSDGKLFKDYFFCAKMEKWFKNQQTLGFEHMTPPHEEMMTCSPQLWLFSSGDHEMSQVNTISQICVDLPHMQQFIFVRP